MTLKKGDRVKILDELYDTGTVVEVDRKKDGWGYDLLVHLDDEPEKSRGVPFDLHELEKIDS